jgi:hypothetical protein
MTSTSASAAAAVVSGEEKKTLDLLERLSKSDPRLFFYITRSKNDNVVIYAANTDAAGNLRANNPVDLYWLDIDEAYVAEARAEGRMSDRVELSSIERNMAYGMETRASATKPNHVAAKLAAYRDRTITLHLDAHTKQPRALGNIQPAGFKAPESARLVRVHVEMDPGLLSFHKVAHIDFYAISLTTGKMLHERIRPE